MLTVRKSTLATADNISGKTGVRMDTHKRSLPVIEKLKKLAELRAGYQANSARVQDAEASAKDTPQWEAYENALDVRGIIGADIEKLEAEIKAEAVDKFIGFAIGKKPFEGLEIKTFTVVKVIDEKAAREWAMKNFTPALKLDTKAIEKAGKENLTPDGLVEITTEHRAQIASDLSGYLKP
jgi:hypothetical protein